MTKKIKDITISLIEKNNKNLNEVARKGNLTISDIVRILDVILQESLSTYLHFAKTHIKPDHFDEIKKLLVKNLTDIIKEEGENNEDN